MMNDPRHDPIDHYSGGSIALHRIPQLSALSFDPPHHHVDPRSFLHDPYPPLRDDFDDRPKPPDPHEIHLPHPTSLPQHDSYSFHHAPDPQPIHYPLGLPMTQYPYMHNTHPDHLSIPHYQQENILQLTQLPAPPLPHDYSYQEPLPPPSPPGVKGQRKSRWRPTLKQREKLEACWAQDQYPDRNMKQAIALELEEPHSRVTAEQVSRWFKHRRESLVQKGTFQYRNEAAAKFSNEQVALLEAVFKANAYPSREEIKSVAEQMLVSQQRVKNWFKARRCRLALRGEFEFKQNSSTGRLTGDRKRKSESPLDDGLAKRPELLPPITSPVDMVGMGDDMHAHHAHHLHPDDPNLHHLPHLNSVHIHHDEHTHVHVDVSNALQGPLVDHISMVKEHEHESHEPLHFSHLHHYHDIHDSLEHMAHHHVRFQDTEEISDHLPIPEGSSLHDPHT